MACKKSRIKAINFAGFAVTATALCSVWVLFSVWVLCLWGQVARAVLAPFAIRQQSFLTVDMHALSIEETEFPHASACIPFA
jgi:hypothetical protein